LFWPREAAVGPCCGGRGAGREGGREGGRKGAAGMAANMVGWGPPALHVTAWEGGRERG